MHNHRGKSCSRHLLCVLEYKLPGFVRGSSHTMFPLPLSVYGLYIISLYSPNISGLILPDVKNGGLKIPVRWQCALLPFHCCK